MEAYKAFETYNKVLRNRITHQSMKGGGGVHANLDPTTGMLLSRAELTIVPRDPVPKINILKIIHFKNIITFH